MKSTYIYIEKMAEIMQLIQMEAVDSKVPIFSSLNITSRYTHLASEMNWYEQDKFWIFKACKTRHTITKISIVLMIFKGSMQYLAAITNKHWISKKHIMYDFLIGNGQKVRKYYVQE